MDNKNLKIAVGIPTINRADLLKECLEDLATNMPDMDSLLIVDNGNQNIIIPPVFKKVVLHIPSKNLGVAGSWNFMMQKAFTELNVDYLLILNDDIVLGKTTPEILNVIKKYPAKTLIVGKFLWSSFVLRKDIIKEVGYFDEKFFPAYYEDNDFRYRCRLVGSDIIIGINGLTPLIKRNSESIKKDPSLEKGSPENHKYYKKKWGGDPHHEKFKTPFNK